MFRDGWQRQIPTPFLPKSSRLMRGTSCVSLRIGLVHMGKVGLKFFVLSHLSNTPPAGKKADSWPGLRAQCSNFIIGGLSKFVIFPVVTRNSNQRQSILPIWIIFA